MRCEAEQADIRNPFRFLLITSLPLRGISAGVQAPAETGKPPLKEVGDFPDEVKEQMAEENSERQHG